MVELITSERLSKIIGIPWTAEVSESVFDVNLSEILAVFEILNKKLEEVFGPGHLDTTFKVDGRKIRFSFENGRLKIKEL